MDNSFLHSKRLLLVDDEQELLKMVSDILKDAGFETVLTAMSVKKAILTAKEETPDLIVLDVMLPDGDGFSLMQQLRTFTNVPIIFLTAKDEATDKLSGLGLGADDYISKPFMPQELLLRIYAVLRRTYKEDSPLLVLDGCKIDFSRAEVYIDHHLANTLPVIDGKRFGREVYQDYADLAAIVRIDSTRRVQQCDAMFQCQAATGAHLCLIAFRQRDI